MSLKKVSELEQIGFEDEYLFGKSKFEVFDACWCEPFPGTSMYEPNNPIWECNVYNKMSPKQAWEDSDMLDKAIDNLFWICYKAIKENKYPEFLKRIENAFSEGGLKLQREVLLRFTIAKIAPKVTSLQASVFEKIIEEAGIDISNGIYCPMAGFGGIIRGAKRYYKKHGIDASVDAYDINPTFCNYYGWKQRDVLAQVIKTDKVVFACPPFGPNTERWPDTPENMYYDFHTWCKLIKDYIIAPNYILVGPEIRTFSKYKSGKTPNGLFRKKYGIQYYPEYSI